MKRYILLAALLIIILCACGKIPQEQKPQEPVPPDASQEIPPEIEKEAPKPRLAGGHIFVLGEKTKLVLDDGSVVALKQVIYENTGTMLPIETGLRVDNIKIDVNQEGKEEAIFSGPPYTQYGMIHVLRSTGEIQKIAEEMIQQMMDYKFADVADYRIEKNTVISQKGGTAELLVLLDILPTNESRAFAEYNPLDNFGKQTWIEDKSYTLRLVGTDGVWIGFLEEIVEYWGTKVAFAPEFTPNDEQKILYKTDDFLLYQQKTPWSGDENYVGKYSLFLMTFADEKIKALVENVQNMGYKFFADTGKKVYFTSPGYAPHREEDIGKTIVYDKATATIEEKDFGYLAWKNTTYLYAAKDNRLLEINRDTGVTRDICDFPFGWDGDYTIYSVTEDTMEILYTTTTSQHMRQKINLKTGEITQYGLLE